MYSCALIFDSRNDVKKALSTVVDKAFNTYLCCKINVE